ncbi:hypothetical protein LINGRAPRIM_LOCUS899 [Linum grandiflorum]
MCLKMGYYFKKGKWVKVHKNKNDDVGDDEEPRCKGLLSAEIQRWNIQQQQQQQISLLNNSRVEEPSSSLSGT